MLGQQAKILKTISTFNGTLYKNEIVKVDRSENEHYRIVDSSGRIWYVEKKDITLLKEKKLDSI